MRIPTVLPSQVIYKTAVITYCDLIKPDSVIMIIFEFPEIHNLRFNTLSKMRIINKNSKNRIKVGVTEIGSYLEINKPIVLE